MSLGSRVAVATILLTGCASASSSVADNGEAATILRAAATKTLAVESFHAQTTFQASAGDATGTVDYQAPDREDEVVGIGRDGNESISIGDTVYFSALGRPGYFWKFEHRGIGASDALMWLHLLEQAENVRLDGHLYRFDLAQSAEGLGQGTSATGVATLTDEGFINTLLYHLTVQGAGMTIGYTYSGYDSGITVEPPPPDLVVKQTPGIACPTDSGTLPGGGDICNVISPMPVEPSPSSQ